MTNNRDTFHDYLNLKDKDYSNDKFIVFYGNSWAWKSSYMLLGLIKQIIRSISYSKSS